MGIRHLIADISAENTGGLAFHKKNGFKECGRFENVGHKLGRDFGVVYMQKDL